MKHKFKISKEKRNEMVLSIKTYFSEERNEELGELGASIILDFIIEEIAPVFYNQGVFDSYVYLNDRVEDVLGIQK